MYAATGCAGRARGIPFGYDIRRIEIRFVRQVLYINVYYTQTHIYVGTVYTYPVWTTAVRLGNLFYMRVQCSMKKQKRYDSRITETVVIYTVVAKVRCNIALPGPIIIIIVGIYTRMCARTGSRAAVVVSSSAQCNIRINNNNM